MKQDSYLTLDKRINSNWIKGLIVRPDTIKFLEENTGVAPWHKFGFLLPKSKAIKAD